MKREIIEITENNIDDINYDNIIAVTIAEGGAMGEPNSFYAVDYNMQRYYTNFNSEKISFDRLNNKFVLLKNFSCFMECVNNLDNGWNWFNMGYGNYLILRQKYYTNYKKYIEENFSDDYEHGELYQKWYETLKKIMDKEVYDCGQ